MDEFQFDTVVIGAGIAGLTAAHALAQAGRRVAILEARSRIGGRIHSMRTGACDLPIELGAEFIHGKPENLWQLISQAGLSTFELEGNMLCLAAGQLEACECDEDFALLHELPEQPDQTFAAWLAQRQLPPDAAHFVTAYVEGFNAADANVISTAALVKQQHAEDAIEGDRLFRIYAGYASVAEYLRNAFEAAGGKLFLSTIVHTIRWQPGAVYVEAISSNDDRHFLCSATQCVITLPLGVLQAGSVRFDPVPHSHMLAASKLAMGSVKKIIFVFCERFWSGRYADASFIFSEDDDLPRVWWTAFPDPAPTLTGWIAGRRAQALSAISDDELLQTSLTTLAKLFALPVERLQSYLLSWHIHNWDDDPFSRGAYSYIPKDGLGALEILTSPVDNTLFFAGEHTDLAGYWGTVHAAMGSGLRAAGQAMEAVRG